MQNANTVFKLLFGTLNTKLIKRMNCFYAQ